MLSAVGPRYWRSALILSMRFVCFSFCLLLASGCGKSKGTVLGKPPSGEAQTILAVHAGTAPSSVVLKGVMFEKCPAAGCWFRLRDQTGVIKVSTKSAGFVVVDVPLNVKMTVAGTVVASGNDVEIEAAGLRY
jgi:uncharacterized protein YdeI (BOF family)